MSTDHVWLDDRLGELAASKSHPDLRGARELAEAGRVEDAIKSAFAVGIFAARKEVLAHLAEPKA